MSALEELKSGVLGDEFIVLLQRTAFAVGVSRNFPPPEGHAAWDAAAVATAVNDFLASPQTPRRLTDLATRCRTLEALRRQLQAAVRNFYADESRRTPVGRLILRINEILTDDDSFERQGHLWALAGSETPPPIVDHEALVTALSRIEVVVPATWTGKRTGPDIDAASVRDLAVTALSAMGGPLRAADIARAVAERLGLGGPPLSIEATGFDPPSAFADGMSVEDQVVTKERAREVFGRLNDPERISIGLTAPVSKLGPILGVSPSKAALIRNRAVAILKDELDDEEDGQMTFEAVLALSQEWAGAVDATDRSDVGPV